MEDMIKSRREYGGFLPLELNAGNEYFNKYEEYISRFNSVKAILDYVLKTIGKNNIYLPYYYCPSTISAIKNTGYNIYFYHIDSNMMPIGVEDNSNCVIIFVDYFGVQGKKITELTDHYVNAEIIIDRAHSFFEEPIIKKNVYNVYSAKKFFGVPDGAYLISKNLKKDFEEYSSSLEYINYLLVAYENGTNDAYNIKKEADKVIASNYNSMSKISLGLLKNVNYNKVRDKRRLNYKYLYKRFKNVNGITIPSEADAYLFPLVIEVKGRSIKENLIKEKIYVPTLWQGNTLMREGNETEIMMAKDAIFLPIDQRYDEEDMSYIADRVNLHINIPL